MDMLCSYSKLPQFKTAVLLIVGSQGIGKHQLARTLVDAAKNIRIQCRTATSLPLPSENSSTRPRIDFVTFIVDVYNRLSFSDVEKSLLHLDKHYFIGKICLVATHALNQNQMFVEVDKLTQLADSYDCPLVWADIDDDADRQVLAKTLLRYLTVSSGLCPGVSPLLIDTTKQDYASDVL